MFHRYFIIKNRLFTYSNHVFQIPHFYIRDATEKGATMSRPHRRKIRNKSIANQDNLASNVQERLSTIKLGQIKKSSVTEYKVLNEPESQKENVIYENEPQNKLLPCPSSPALTPKKLTIAERLALRNKLKIKVNNTAEMGVFLKNVSRNYDLNENVINTKHNKEVSTTIVKLPTENISSCKDVMPALIQLHGKKIPAQERVFSIKSPDQELGDKKLPNKYDGRKETSLVGALFDVSTKDFKLNLKAPTLEGNKPKNLSYDRKSNAMKQSNSIVFDKNEQLMREIDHLSKLFMELNINAVPSSKPLNILRERLDCLGVVARPILKAKRSIPQKRLLSTSTSCNSISSTDNESQPLKSIQINETDEEKVKLASKELCSSLNRSSDRTGDVNFNNIQSDIDINANTAISSKKPLEYKHIKVENSSELQSVHEKFPFPKNTLHNYYHVLAEQKKDKSLNVEPYYKIVKKKSWTEWTCTYHLKWPEYYKVSAPSLTKKKASSFAALKCLALLEEHEKISSDGLPLIYDKEEVKKLTQAKQTELKFDENMSKNMQNIVNIFNEKMSPIVNKVDYNKYEHQENEILEGKDSVFLRAPLYLGVHEYISKEKVILPISEFKDAFIDLIQKNNCVIVKGEPGCGKSSRVPQYVLEAWVKEATSEDQLCRIAVTQPRRIAAISLAKRVASERDEQLGRIVGYQVRLKSSFQPSTGRILYCTTGILLRHLQSDSNLTNFSHVILDEAHERDVNTDLLMNLMKRALKSNENLKVVVMSATIDANEFSEYFDGAPVFNVPGFTYPITKHFLDSCKLDVSKTIKMCSGEIPQVIHENVAQVLGHIHKNKPEGAILTFLPGWDDLVKVQKLIPLKGDVVVHLVHSKLKDSEQHQIFSKPPPGVRKIILATNIAETSITIDDVVYVVDTGIHKDKIFDNDKGIDVIDMEWISKASANQRAGRAGRCSPGESYHLYTEERFNQFPDYSSPKILNSSLTKVVLDSKMYSNNMDACDFMNDLLAPPDKVAVERAVAELKQLELLDEQEKLTPLGRTLVSFQLEPNLAKVMVNAVVFKCTTPIVDIITLFSSDTGIFGSSNLTDKDRIRNIKSQFCKSSDHLALMRVYEKWLEMCEEGDSNAAYRFCRDAKLVPYKLEFVKQLKDVHFGYLYNGLYESMPTSEDFSDNDELVKAILYSGTGTVLQHRNWDIVKHRLKTNVNLLVTRNNHKATISSESVNYKRQKFPSDFLVYINETRSNIKRTTIVRECSLISPVSVLLFSKGLEILKANPKSDSPNSDNLVIIGIKNTKLQFLCDKSQADILINCKEAIDASHKYLIHQLTYAGEEIPEFLKHWDDVLMNLNDILEKSKID